MKRNLSILFIAAMAILLFSNSLYGQSGKGKLEGTWEMRTEDDGLHVEFKTTERNRRDHNQLSLTIDRSDISGLTTGSNINFTINKPGGEVAMTGDFNGEEGDGTFTYTPNESYVKSFADEGYEDLSLQILLLFTLKDADADFVRDINKLGYTNISEGNLIALVSP